MEQRPLPTALYCRLSREDGDRMESDSIGNQRKLLEEYIENHPDLAATTSKRAATWSAGCRSTACASSPLRTISTAPAAPTT